MSGSTVEGEGEAKIIKAIRAAQPLSRLAMNRKRTKRGNEKKHRRHLYASPASLATTTASIARSWCRANDRHVVIGSDSDLMLMLTMLETNYEEELLRWDVNDVGGNVGDGDARGGNTYRGRTSAGGHCVRSESSIALQ